MFPLLNYDGLGRLSRPCIAATINAKGIKHELNIGLQQLHPTNMFTYIL